MLRITQSFWFMNYDRITESSFWIIRLVGYDTNDYWHYWRSSDQLIPGLISNNSNWPVWPFGWIQVHRQVQFIVHLRMHGCILYERNNKENIDIRSEMIFRWTISRFRICRSFYHFSLIVLFDTVRYSWYKAKRK